MRRTVAIGLCAVQLAACGNGDDADEPAQQPSKVPVAYQEIEETLGDADQQVPEATGPAAEPETEGAVTPESMPPFLDEVLADVRRYWSKTAPLDVRNPTAKHVWVPSGEPVGTECSRDAGDDSAFYCPPDDTIYISTRLASEVWQGLREDYPGQKYGHGRAIGNFGVSFLVAHEYAHNIQADVTRKDTPDLDYFLQRELELHADCLAGLWANSVYREGRIHTGDVQEAISTVLALGDFYFDNPDHHGTPAQRVQAWRAGYATGDPKSCGDILAPKDFTKEDE